MKKVLTETELKQHIHNIVKEIINEVTESETAITPHTLLPEYKDYVMRLCHVFILRGTDMDLDAAHNFSNKETSYLFKQLGCKNDFPPGMANVYEFYTLKDKALHSSNPKEELALLRKTWENSKDYKKSIVNSERNAVQLFRLFNEYGYFYISNILEQEEEYSTECPRKFEKEAGLALFGENNGLKKIDITLGAVYCVRDFSYWVSCGMPEYTNDSDSGEEGTANISIEEKIKKLLNNVFLNPTDIAKYLVRNINGDMKLQKKFKALIDGYRNPVYFKVNASDNFNEFVSLIKNNNLESAINALF